MISRKNREIPLGVSVLRLLLMDTLDGEDMSLQVDLQLLRLESSDVELDGELLRGILDFTGLVGDGVVEVDEVLTLGPVRQKWLLDEVAEESERTARVRADGHG